MATISCTVQRSSWYEVYFEYSYTQNKDTAVTTVSHALKLKQITDSYDFDTVGAVTVSYVVAGKTFSKTERININDKGNKGYTITLASGTSTITHNASTGVGSFTVSVNTSIESAGYGPGTITLSSQTVSLPTIYRASKPTVSASSVKMGNTLTITTNRKSTSFTHTLQYTFGGTTTTVATGVGESYPMYVPQDLAARCNNALSGTATITCTTYNGSTKIGTETCTVTFTVPNKSKPSTSVSSVALGNTVRVNTNRESSNFTHKLELLFNGEVVYANTGIASYVDVPLDLSLAKKIPSKTEDEITISCVTYNGSAVVGTDTNKFKVTVPNNSTTQPKASFSLTRVGDLPYEFYGLYIQNKTSVKADFTASSEYSAISSYKMSVDGIAYSGNPATSKVLTKDGTVTVTGSVTDARGYSNTSLSNSITVHPYKPPTLRPYSGNSSIVCERSLQDGTYNDEGTYLHIKCELNYYPVVVDNWQRNTCTLSYMYKIEGGEWSAESVIFVSKSADNISTEHILPDVVTQTRKSYAIRLIVRDALGAEESYDFGIPTADVTLHLAEKGAGVAVGKFSEASESNKMFECAFPAYFYDDVKGTVYGLGGLVDIPPNADLNDAQYREFGCYGITANSTATTIRNLPPNITPQAGIIRVYDPTGYGRSSLSGHQYVAQEYTSYISGDCYRRLLHRDGNDTEWTEENWVAIGGVDSVIESGTITTSDNVEWYYRKWYNGTAECWAKKNINIDVTAQWGSMYCVAAPRVTLPFTFASPPVCHTSVDAEYCLFVMSNGSASTTTVPSVMLGRPDPTTGINVNVFYSVHGLWR